VVVLALDSRSVRGSAALWREGRVVDLRPSDPERSFSSQLPALLGSLVAAQGLGLRDVDVFAACIGPGSLTGLRVGLSTVQGLAFATNRLVVGVSALEAVAVDALETRPATGAAWIGAWLDAFRGEVFTALYRVGDRGATGHADLIETEAPAVGPPEEAAARWTAITSGSTSIVAGDDVARSAIAAALGGRAVCHDTHHLAGTVARLAAERAAGGAATRPHALHPLYVRRPDAEVARDRRLEGQLADGGR
jgi:tRNA threonylcarbamoyladenosine biosynthesis protein TsaB